MTPQTFTWHGRELEQADYEYNRTITNERAVEIPIAFDFLREHKHGDVTLEVGNVLSHYYPSYSTLVPGGPARRIVDRYEKAPGVENLDVFAIDGPFDWIVSISTIEHVRMNEGEQYNPWGAVAALAYLRGLLREGGRMLVTVGLGQNPVLDEFLLEAIFGEYGSPVVGTGGAVFTRTRGAEPHDNEWREAWRDGSDEPARSAWSRGQPVPYGPTHGANAVWIGEWEPT